MEKQNQISKSHSRDSDNSNSKTALIREWVARFALNADKPLNAKEQAVYCSTWADGFADVDYSRLNAVFIACLRSHKFKTIPTIGDIRQHLARAESNTAEEQAALKFDEVLGELRRHYSPDIPWHGRKISEPTQRAINEAGGMGYLVECIGDNLVFARKRFIESWLRWDELQQDRHLLPEGEVKKLLAETAQRLGGEA